MSLRKIIAWKDQAKSDLRAVDRLKALQILQALDRLSLTGEGDILRIQGIDPPEFRLRVGDYRLRFYKDEDTITVPTVDKQADAYR